MNAFIFPAPPPCPESEALRLEVRDFLKTALADRKPVERAESWTGMDADFSRQDGPARLDRHDLAEAAWRP